MHVQCCTSLVYLTHSVSHISWKSSRQRDGCDTAWYFSRRRSCQQIHAQPRSIALECSQACVQISSCHKRPRHSFWRELNLKRSWLYRLKLCRLCGQPEINNQILFQTRKWTNLMEVETLGLHNHLNDRSGICSHVHTTKETLWLGQLAHTLSRCYACAWRRARPRGSWTKE